MKDRELLARIAEIPGLESSIIVGGQAILLWSEHYLTKNHRDISTNDVDYFGRRATARALAAATHSPIAEPTPDDHTPNNAVVTLETETGPVTVDFLSDVAGVDPNAIEPNAVELRFAHPGGAGEMSLRLLHPLHCLQSKLANRIELGRRSTSADAQLGTALDVLDAFVEDLAERAPREAMRTLTGLSRYIETDRNGQKAHKHLESDPLDLLQRAAADPRFDERWRALTLGTAIARIAADRARRDAQEVAAAKAAQDRLRSR